MSWNFTPQSQITDKKWWKVYKNLHIAALILLYSMIFLLTRIFTELFGIQKIIENSQLNNYIWNSSERSDLTREGSINFFFTQVQILGGVNTVAQPKFLEGVENIIFSSKTLATLNNIFVWIIFFFKGGGGGNLRNPLATPLGQYFLSYKFRYPREVDPFWLRPCS